MEGVMKKVTLQLETLSCPACAAKVQAVLKKSKGVKESEVLFNSSRVKVSYDAEVINLEEIKGKISKLGYSTLSAREE
jgi:copper chaperone